MQRLAAQAARSTAPQRAALEGLPCAAAGTRWSGSRSRIMQHSRSPVSVAAAVELSPHRRHPPARCNGAEPFGGHRARGRPEWPRSFEGAARSCLRAGRVSICNVGGGGAPGVNNARATAVRIRAWCHGRSTGLVDAAGLDVGARISQWVCASSPKSCPWKGRFVWPRNAWVRQRA